MNFMNRINYQYLFIGILIGAGLIFAFMWYTNRNSSDKYDDWWCSYLKPSSDAKYCHNLYLKFQTIIDKMGTDDQPCIPDYMGGCN